MPEPDSLERRPIWVAALVFTLLPLAVLAVVQRVEPATYRDLVQEDGPVEWITVTALIIATWFFVRSARQQRASGRLPWFSIGLAAFCVFFAGEEISWGQRAISYQPPAYFLEHNEQQELNLHNLFKSVVRTKYILMALLAGWGVTLPLLHANVPSARTLIDKLGIDSPGVVLVPGMAATLILLITYPWSYTGEVAECLFALGLLTASILTARPLRPARSLALAGTVALALGAAIPVASDVLFRADVERVDLTSADTEQLAVDWKAQLAADKKLPSGCGTHMRVHTWVTKKGHDEVAGGAFASGSTPELGESDPVRRQYFLDPWNNAYWIWHTCAGGKQRVLFYSFGPNRRRDSTKTEMRADDIGTELVR